VVAPATTPKLHAIGNVTVKLLGGLGEEVLGDNAYVVVNTEKGPTSVHLLPSISAEEKEKQRKMEKAKKKAEAREAKLLEKKEVAKREKLREAQAEAQLRMIKDQIARQAGPANAAQLKAQQAAQQRLGAVLQKVQESEAKAEQAAAEARDALADENGTNFVENKMSTAPSCTWNPIWVRGKPKQTCAQVCASAPGLKGLLSWVQGFLRCPGLVPKHRRPEWSNSTHWRAAVYGKKYEGWVKYCGEVKKGEDYKKYMIPTSINESSCAMSELVNEISHDYCTTPHDSAPFVVVSKVSRIMTML
jgi:hypothetical protein